MGKGRRFKKLTRKPTGMRLLGKPRCNWKDNIRMGLKYSGRFGKLD